MLDRINSRLERYLGTSEIAESKRLQWVFYGLILGFYMAYQSWIFSPPGSSTIRKSLNYACPEYFRNCDILYSLTTVPVGYGFQYLFIIFFMIMTGAVVAAGKGRWGLACTALIPLFFGKVVIATLLSAEVSIPFETFHLVPCFIFLFTRNRFENLRVCYVLLYFLAGVVKLHEGWILGTYFSSLRLGLPGLPREVIPVLSNLVMIMELFGIWFLFSRNKTVKSIPFWFFIGFHFYSIFYVGFRYPLLCMPFIIALFGGEVIAPRHKVTVGAWVVYGLLILANVLPFMFPGDAKITYEGMEFAVNMFDANRQVISTERAVFPDGRVQEKKIVSANGLDRLTPYRLWYRIQNHCKQDPSARVEWTMDISKNGSPFYRLVDETNACDLKFSSLQHNAWIRLDPKVVGYPDYNFYYPAPSAVAVEFGTPTVSAEPRIELSGLQKAINAHINAFRFFYVMMAVLSPLMFLIPALRKKLNLFYA